MKTYRHIIIGTLLLWSLTAPAAAQRSLLESGANASVERFAIVPEPLSLTPQAGYFGALDDVDIVTAPGDSLAFEAQHLKALIRTECGMLSDIETKRCGDGPHITLKIDPTITAPEGYRLKVTPDDILITGGTPRGVFYGIETLRQIISPGVKRQFTVPCVSIADEPRFPYRGMMLDPARNYLPVDDIERFIDAMAMYKFNALHLHLTDDQGWRIEIKRYPLLTEVGSVRSSTNGDGKPQKGFYTQDELRGLVQYANERNITIIPEIEMPGHTVAALAAYPGLSCPTADAPTTARTTPGLDSHILCMGNDSVYTFIDDVIGEVAGIFPGDYIHIGGDAAPLHQWEACPKCSAVARANNLPDSCRMLSYFIGKVNESLQKHGKKPMVWYEVNEDMSYPAGSVAYAWRKGVPTEEVIASAREHSLPLICAPSDYAYFDFPQWNNEEQAEGMPLLSLKQSYEFDPGYGLSADKAGNIAGLEATVWGEYMPDIDRIFYMTFPRALALSEAGWSRMDRRSWSQFSAKLHWQLSRLMQYGISFRQPTEVYHQ